MANTFTSRFVQHYRNATAVATAALGGLGTDVVTGAMLLATAGTNDSIVMRLTAMPRDTNTASSLMLFIMQTDGFYRPLRSKLMTGYTFSATTEVPTTEFATVTEDTPIYLGAGEKLYVGTKVALAAGIVFDAQIGDF